MTEPKYYDEMPSYIMHSDGEFKDGVFKAVDGRGNSLTIGAEKSDGKEKLTIEGAEKAEFSTIFRTVETPYPSEAGAFKAKIGDITVTLRAEETSVEGLIYSMCEFVFEKGDKKFTFTLPPMDPIPKNVKDGSGTNSLVGNGFTSANGMSQTVIGKYNIKQGNADTIQPTDNAFIIGNGTSNKARSNAFAVRWDGAIVLANGTVLTVEQLAKVANLT